MKYLLVIALLAALGGCSSAPAPVSGPLPKARTWESIPDDKSVMTSRQGSGPAVTKAKIQSNSKSLTASCKGGSAFVLLIDKSRSTLKERTLDILKLAAQELLTSLPDQTEVSVIGFDSSAFILFSMAPLDPVSRNRINERLTRLYPTDTTVLVPGLKAAEEALVKTKQKCKTIVVLTDGMIKDLSSALSVSDTIQAQGIAIAVGLLEEKPLHPDDKDNLKKIGSSGFTSSSQADLFVRSIATMIR